ncbi:hypothetical protein MHW47_19400 [Streptomyces sp. OfavH-34-F]|uniref:hypothetical protein n=1 Tax=Streptomyces sp. OfavH-34-F TaxID=2917760 RepID=UPI001EF2D0A6|nr:hypothetical protein [Streptomyces sp. OfavH-34-F]MCG7526606.1 hypothetical protein [Streptomyces sp. OfavH-34-F]
MTNEHGDSGTIEAVPAGADVAVTVSTPSGTLSFVCSPERARALAAALGLAADEAGNGPADPVTVRADALRRGDVRDGDRAMTVTGVRVDGATAHVTWSSGAGRVWTQTYDADARITLRRRGRPAGT